MYNNGLVLSVLTLDNNHIVFSLFDQMDNKLAILSLSAVQYTYKLAYKLVSIAWLLTKARLDSSITHRNRERLI